MSDTLRNTATTIVERLHEAGHEAWWVGGCVRDAALGVEVKDYDIATSARPDEVCGIFPKSDLVGAHFGVALIVEDGASFDVATYRKDGKYIDHRRPTEVSFGTMEEDARRRDFTVNALYYDPAKQETVDPVGGQSDLDDRVLRAIGEPLERFQEDALRLLRAVRFSVRFGLTIEPATRDALMTSAPMIAEISAERVRDELVLMLIGPRPGQAIRALSELGLLRVVLPEIEAMKGVEQPAEFHPEGDVFTHTCLALDAMTPALGHDRVSPTLAMGVLLHDVGKPPTFRRAPDRIRFDLHMNVGAELADAICRRLSFSRRDREEIVSLVKRHMRFMDVQRMKVSTLKRFMAAPNFDEDLALHRADVSSYDGGVGNYDYCVQRREEFQSESRNILPEPFISGADLIAMGHTPGPRFREILDALADAQMEGEVTTKEEAEEWVRGRHPLEGH